MAMRLGDGRLNDAPKRRPDGRRLVDRRMFDVDGHGKVPGARRMERAAQTMTAMSAITVKPTASATGIAAI